MKLGMTTRKNVFFFLLIIFTVVCFLLSRKKGLLINNNKQGLFKSKSVCDEIIKRTDSIPVKTFNGPPPKVNFSRYPEAKLFYTRITEAASLGPNFAGHFTFAYWGCGMLCFQYVIIDSITGNIVVYEDSPVEEVIDPTFSINSRILVFNPKNSFTKLDGKKLEDILKDFEYETGWVREYYEIVDGSSDRPAWLNKLCSENVLDGLFVY